MWHFLEVRVVSTQLVKSLLLSIPLLIFQLWSFFYHMKWISDIHPEELPSVITL